MAFPRASVIVIVVLLNVALTCTTPSASTIFLVFFAVAMLLGHLLLAGDRATRALLGAGVGVRALTPDRQPATVADAPVRADVHEALDVHRDLGPQRALDLVVALDLRTETGDVRIGQVLDPQRAADPGRLEDGERRGAA